MPSYRKITMNGLYIITLCLTLLAAATLAATGHHGRSQAAEFLWAQNAIRVRVGERPLVWDARLTHYSQWWANQRRQDCSLLHSNGPYGENIFWGSGKGWRPADATRSWLSESRYYRYMSNSCGGGRMCGHYTQIVWRRTQRIGCARVVCLWGAGVFMICNYDPPGNYVGERPY